MLEALTAAALSVAKTVAGKAVEALRGELGDAVVDRVKGIIEAKIAADREVRELAREELKAWRAVFGPLPSTAHPAAQIIRASVRPFLTVFVTVVVAVALLKGLVEPDMIVKAWYVIVGAWFGERIFRHYVRKDE